VATFFVCLLFVVQASILGFLNSQVVLAQSTLEDDLLVALDIESDYVEEVVAGDNVSAIAVVVGSRGFLTPIQGDSFIVISSGSAQPLVFPQGWVGASEDELSEVNDNPAGVCPLGGAAFDIVTLSFTLRAPEEANSFSFNFRFMSEEYPEYVGQQYNDFFSCLLDGENIVFDTQSDIINVNNNFFDPNIKTVGTVFNAATVLLTAKTPIEGGSTFVLEFVLGDVGDEFLDSAVFIDNLVFSADSLSESTTEASFLVSDYSIRDARSLSVVGGVVVGVTAMTALLAVMGPAINSVIMNLPLPSQLRSFLKFYGANLFQKVDKIKLKALQNAPFIAKEELIALGISVLFVTLVYSFVETNGIAGFLNLSVLLVVIPSTFISVAIVTSTKVFADAYCARTCNAYRKFSLWITGFLTFIISGLLFLFPFSSPGITRYQSIEIAKKTKGLLILSKTLILLTLTIPFSIMFLMGLRIIADTGVLFVLMSACYSLVPIKYLSGKVVFDYNKKYSLMAFGLAAFLFISFTVNLLPAWIYFPVGVVSAVLTMMTLKRLKLSQNVEEITGNLLDKDQK
jgi:hypothetical protein